MSSFDFAQPVNVVEKWFNLKCSNTSGTYCTLERNDDSVGARRAVSGSESILRGQHRKRLSCRSERVGMVSFEEILSCGSQVTFRGVGRYKLGKV